MDHFAKNFPKAQQAGRELAADSMSAIAHVQPERLSDKSVAFNVVIPASTKFDIQKTVVIGAISESAAQAIVSAINDGAAWIDA